MGRVARNEPADGYSKGTVKRPELPAYPTGGGGLRVWCCWCGEWHSHGNGYGHRAAHCVTQSPYCETGYILTDPEALERLWR